jgi:Arc/MetJ-type ribon-helix-helix transcriptional regulator
MVSKAVPITFQNEMIKEMDDYVDSGLYSSKAEFVREAVRKLIIELRKQLFFSNVKDLKQLTKSEGVKISSPYLTKKQKDEVFNNLDC